MTEELVPYEEQADKLKLTRKQRNIAVLDALGWTRQDIAAGVGVNVSYVSHLRKNRDYRKLVARYVGDADLEAIVKADFIRMHEIAGMSMEKLVELMEAEDSEGRPLTAVQFSAAKTAFEQYTRAIVAMARGRDSGDDGDRSPPVAATITVNLMRGEDGAVMPIIEAGEYTEKGDE